MAEDRFCRNCGEALVKHHKFCYNCGQKFGDQLPTVGQLVREFLSGLFNLEFQFLPSFGLLFSPGRLSLEYISGKRKKYLSPVRFFLLSVIVLLSVTNFIIRGDTFGSGGDKIRKEAILNKGAQQILTQFDSACVLAEMYYPNALSPALTDSLKKWMVPPDMANIDSEGNINLNQLIGVQIGSKENGVESGDVPESGITLTDLMTLHPDSLVRRSNAEGFWGEMIVRQLSRISQESSRLPSFFAEKALWMVLLLIPLFAVWMKILYIRLDRYYIEHLVFLFHIHTFGFFMLSVILMLHDMTGLEEWLETSGIPIVLGAALLYILVALKRFYCQNWTWTLLKFFAGAGIYFLLSGCILVLSMVISFLLF